MIKVMSAEDYDDYAVHNKSLENIEDPGLKRLKEILAGFHVEDRPSETARYCT